MKNPFNRAEDKQRDLEEELATHLKMSADDHRDRGELSQQASQSARREFGNAAVVEAVTRDQWSGRWLDEFLQDLRFAARTLRKSPGFTLVAILTLALGIGANTSLFSVVNAVLLNPVPYPHPEQLVMLHESKPELSCRLHLLPQFPRLAARQPQLFVELRHHTFSTSFTLTGLGEAEELPAQFISSDFFSLLSVQPVLGRFFRTGRRRNRRRAHRPRQRQLLAPKASRRNRRHRKNSQSRRQGLHHRRHHSRKFRPLPARGSSQRHLRAHRPMEQSAAQQARSGTRHPRHRPAQTRHLPRTSHGRHAARHRQSCQRVHPAADKGIGATLVDFRKEMLGNVQPVLIVLLGAVGFVLLIACANVANLFLARSTGRAREFAIRAALGAGRTRLVRQLLTESLLLALSGGALGLLIAEIATHSALDFLPTQLPRSSAIGIDAHVLFFTAGISLLAGILFGIVPALRTSHPHLHDTLKEGGRGGSGSRNRAQGVFVVAEMAMALVLLVGAGLMVRSLVVLWRTNPGFDPANVVTFGLALPPSILGAHADTIRAQIRDLDRKFAATPGVESASQSWAAFPMSSDDEQLFWIDGEPKPASENDMKWSVSYVVQPDYLNVMKIALKTGRFFNNHDDEHSTSVAVVDEEFARKYFHGENPLGQRVHMSHLEMGDGGKVFEIVGVVGHVNQWGLDSDLNEQLRAQIYLSCLQMPDDYIVGVPGGGGTFVAVRSALPTEQLVEGLRRTSREINSDQAIYNVQTMNGVISANLAARRFSMILLASFAGLALLLSSIGIYGVVSYVVGEKTREIGLRMALGASHTAVLGMVLTQGGKPAAAGVILGLAASLALTRLMGAMLYGISATDPFTFIAVGALLTTVALAARCYVPARRATQVDPMGWPSAMNNSSFQPVRFYLLVGAQHAAPDLGKIDPLIPLRGAASDFTK